MRPDPENATQAELREHLRSLGWTELDVLQAGQIPWQVLHICNRPLTQAEEEYALSLKLSLPKK